MKKVGIVAVLFASVLFVSAQTKTNKIVEANEFRLVDGSGKVRASLSMNTYGRLDSVRSSTWAGPRLEIACISARAMRTRHHPGSPWVARVRAVY